MKAGLQHPDEEELLSDNQDRIIFCDYGFECAESTASLVSDLEKCFLARM
jgi:hypothetical protein